MKEVERAIMIKKYVGQTIQLKCKRSKRDKLLRPFEKKHLRFFWSKDGKVRHLYCRFNISSLNFESFVVEDSSF